MNDAYEFSVIIPALNEAKRLPAALAPVLHRAGVETLVVDGGSQDGTATVAEQHGAKTLAGPSCRAIQMNIGAAAAKGRTLVFLHADTLLPHDWPVHVRRALTRPGVRLGAFRLRFSPETPALRLIAAAANMRSRVWGLPYGDQALFMAREVFESLGGFHEWPLMEDFEFARRVGASGVHIASAYAVTSSRRWIRKGLLRTSVLNQLVILGYYAGVSPHTLASWYRGKNREKHGRG